MNELLETKETPETTKDLTKTLTDRQTSTIGLIESSGIPNELKMHFTDMIKILGKDTSEYGRAKQIMNIADELNLAKRVYLDDHKIESIPEANILVDEIIKNYAEIKKVGE